MNRSIRNTILLLIFAFSGTNATAATEAEYISKVISQLDSYITWAADKTFEGGDTKIVISAVGSSDLITQMRKLGRQKSATGKQLKVRIVQPDMIPSNSHILLLDIDDSNQVKTITDKLRGTGTLVISHAKGFGSFGSSLNFFKEDAASSDKPTLELNIKIAKAEGLKVKPSLLKIAKVLD